MFAASREAGRNQGPARARRVEVVRLRPVIVVVIVPNRGPEGQNGGIGLSPGLVNPNQLMVVLRVEVIAVVLVPNLGLEQQKNGVNGPSRGPEKQRRLLLVVQPGVTIAVLGPNHVPEVMVRVVTGPNHVPDQDLDLALVHLTVVLHPCLQAAMKMHPV